jgi:hypothetical protein
VANFATSFASVVQTGGKFVTMITILAACVNDTNLPPVSTTPAANLPPVSTTLMANNGSIYQTFDNLK